jgi:hypothetical protein
MPTRKNPYRDPAIAQSFNNIAAMFAPPSGSDAQGFAVANAQRAEAERKAQIYANPDSAQAAELAARLGYANYGQTQPGFAQTDLTNRRAQDVDASTRLRSTQMNNDTVLATNKLDNATKSITSLFGARDPYQVQPAVPAEVAGLVGLPAVPEMRGAPKPMSETEVKGAERQDLRNRGVLTDDNLKDTIMGQQAPVTVQSADGRTVYTTPGNAALNQLPAAAAPTSKTAPLFTAILPGGAQVSAVQREDGLFNAQTNEKLPPEAKVFNVPTPQGSSADVGMGSATNKTKAQALRSSVANANELMKSIDQTVRNNPAAAGFAANIVSFAQDAKQVINELGQTFGGDPNSPMSGAEFQAFANKLLPNTPGYNPVYRQVKSQLLELAYANAKLDNPSGEVSRSALERQIEALGLGGVGNDESVLAVLQGSRGRLERALLEADTLEGVAPAPTKGSLFTPGGVKSTPSANSGGLPIVNTPEEAKALPSGTRFKTPDGVERVRP